jgi:tetratricopeptide (TPR) repeat protein
MRVAVYAIALNEIKHAERFVQACADADTIIVSDTGSTDGTIGALRDAGAVVHSIAVRPWRFDDARNVSLALIPSDIDVCFCLDLDEVPSPGWRAALERGWTPETTLGRYRFVWSRLADGTPAVELAAAKIHLRFGYRWRHMCHEILVADRLPHQRETWLTDLMVDHRPDMSKPRSAYLGLLEAAVTESPNDPRDLFLLARDYVALGRWQQAEDLLRRYLVLAGQNWPLQRATGWRRLAKCRLGLGDGKDALVCLREGLGIAPDLRDLWLDLADLLAERGEWQESYEASQRGLALPMGPSGIPNEPGHAGGRPYYRASLSALQLGHHAQARALAEQADSREPGHKIYMEHWRRLNGL